MRIAELTTYTSRLNGGVFYALTGLLPRLAAEPGSEYRVFGYHDPKTEADRDCWLPLQVEAFRPWPPRLFGYSPAFRPALRRYRPELIHAHGIWTYLSVASLDVHREQGIPLIISLHGMLDQWALGFSKAKKWFAAQLYQDAQLKAAAVLHALTPAEAKSIRSYGLSNPIVIIPNGVDLAEPSLGPPPWRESRGGRDLTLLFLGRIHPKKGLVPLLDAWAEFAHSPGPGRRWRLVVAGWDEIGHEQQLRSRVAGSTMAESVDFIGPVFGPDKAAAFSSAEAFILPSHSEGLPMAVLEAWSHGLPVLISPACNLPCGRLQGAAIEVDPTRASLAEGLERLAALLPEARRAMGQAGRRLVEQRFSWDRVAAQMASVYRNVLDHRPLPAELVYHP